MTESESGRSSRPGWLRRPALERRLDDAFARRLTTLTADAGFGKSTLLAAWTEDVECIWYTTGGNDAALPSLSQGIADAIRAALPELIDLPAAPSASAEGDAFLHAETFAGLLCSVLEAQLTHDVVLVLDDIHRLPAGSGALRLVESLCRQAPETLHLVLASRTPPAFQVGRLRAAGQLLELSAADLAFTPVEIEQLLDGDSDARLAPALYELTAGWPALVRLATQALKPVPAGARHAALEQFRRNPSVLWDYLAEQVFAQERTSVQELLRVAALLDRVTPEICDALGVPEAAATVNDLVRRGLFLERHGDSLSLHTLVREFVLRAWPWPVEEARSVRARAAQWLEGHGRIEEALATLAGIAEHDELARLLAHHGESLLATGAVDTVSRLAELIPRPYRNAAIEQLAGEAHTIRGEHERALECLRRAAGDATMLPPQLGWRLVQAHYLSGNLDEALAALRRSSHGEGDPGDNALLLAWGASVQTRRGDRADARSLAARALEAADTAKDDRALAAAHTAAAHAAPDSDDPSAHDSHLAQALAAAQRAGDPLQTIRIRNSLGSKLLEGGWYTQAIDELDKATAAAELFGYPSLRALSLMNRGLAHWCCGRLVEASADYAAAIAIYRQTGTREICYAIIGSGDVHRERGNIAMARAAYEEGLELAERAGDLQGIVPGLYQLAKVLVDDEPERARRLAQRAVAYGWPDKAWALNASGWIALAQNDREHARGAAEQASAAALLHRDRYGLAESLELKAVCAAGVADKLRLFDEALELWRELGNKLHEAEVELAIAQLSTGSAAHSAGKRARRTLQTLGVRANPSGPAGLLRFVALEPAQPVAIETLGGFRVLREGEPIRLQEWQSKKARDLLKLLLARHGQPTTRETVTEALWPETETAKARSSLSVALSTLRSVLDPDKRHPPEHFVRADNESIAVELDNLAVDVETFLREAKTALALRASGSDDAPERLEYAESLYAGDFLEEDPYADWAVPLREEARAAYLSTARALAENATLAGRHDHATGYLLRILQRDRYDEQANLALVTHLAHAGRHGEARRAYRIYVDRMTDIGIEPAVFPARARSYFPLG
ncbi:MAG TPA: BTAD domain-containing putative transcriptional regulator [Gaiellaceae bacterium]|jgi:DNA-binding SARP family transcriptional activator/Tfp pilus assembly protein PilF|nr:BTAD domain-containing putative transcriptional regulator [Gaiellaceae bacterium]